MFPDQQNNTGSNAPVPQPGPNGHYEVLPPLPIGQNDGHTGHNPYDFIVNPNTAHTRKPFFGSGGGSSFFLRIGLLVAGVVLIMIVAAVIISALAPKGITPGLTSIAERQQEIIRVATAAGAAAQSQTTKNFVANVDLSIASSQQQVLGYLQTHNNTKLGTKTLALDQSSQTDSLLANAASANNYDSVAVQNLSQQLDVYAGLLQTTYKQTSSVSAKSMLASCFTAAEALLTQAKTAGSSD